MIGNATIGGDFGEILGAGFGILIGFIIWFNIIKVLIRRFKNKNFLWITSIAASVLAIIWTGIVLITLFRSDFMDSFIVTHYSNNSLLDIITRYLNNPYIFVGIDNGWFSNHWVQGHYGFEVQTQTQVGFITGFLASTSWFIQTVIISLLLAFVCNYKLLIITAVVDLVYYFNVYVPIKAEIARDKWNEKKELNDAQNKWEQENNHHNILDQQMAFHNESKYNRDKVGDENTSKSSFFEKQRDIERQKYKAEKEAEEKKREIESHKPLKTTQQKVEDEFIEKYLNDHPFSNKGKAYTAYYKYVDQCNKEHDIKEKEEADIKTQKEKEKAQKEEIEKQENIDKFKNMSREELIKYAKENASE